MLKLDKTKGGCYEQCHFYSIDRFGSSSFRAADVFAYSQKKYQEDSIKTSGGDLKITFIGHGTLMLTYAGKVIHADPVSMYADYATLPKADLILVTHEHGDHLDVKAIQAASTANTTVITMEIRRKTFPTRLF